MKVTWTASVAMGLLLCAATASVALARQGGAPPPAEALRVFLDCNAYCDFDNLRRDITYVSWVRDRRDADVHLLITSQRTGGGGYEYNLKYIGLRAFQGSDDEIKFATRQGDTDDEIRRQVSQRIGLGLARYAARGPLAGRLRVTFTAPEGAATAPAPQPKDPWNLWVFQLSANGNASGESQSKSNSFAGSLRADRVSEAWKFRISAGGSRNHSSYTLDEGVFTSTSSRFNSNLLLVRSLSDHWSVGFETSLIRSTRDNYDLLAKLTPEIEFNVFPYKESTRRQFVLFYGLGLNYANYQDTTIFNRLKETRPMQSLTASLEATQPWGSLSGQLTVSSYLDDVSRNRFSLFGFCSVRIVRGLNFNAYANYSRVRDQLSLAKAGATDQEILLQLKALKTDYFYSMSVGLSYTFGSKFNNIVNPRFSNAGGSGSSCFCSGGSCFCS